MAGRGRGLARARDRLQVRISLLGRGRSLPKSMNDSSHKAWQTPTCRAFLFSPYGT